MTTIVATRDMIAGDTQLSGGGTVPKVFRHRGAVVGIAGTYVCCMDFVRWWKKGDLSIDPPSMKNVDALVLTIDGRILCFNYHKHFFEIDNDFAAIGSGADAALGALHAGATPKRAIEIAGIIDGDTGGKVTTRRRGKNHA